jgi:DNA-binding winged helix-turn-helix (wHTH) protein
LAAVPISFGDYVIDVDGRELTRRGERVPLSPKAFELLAVLVAHRPKAMSKAALQDHLWPDTFVVEKNLANLVAEIRQALRDDPADPTFIRTVQRFGYKFCGSAEQAAERPAAARAVRVRVAWPGGHASLPRGQHVVGRDPDAAIFLDSTAVSRRHAAIHVGEDAVTIADLGSKNGTCVNSVALERESPLADGDVVTLGPIELTITILTPSRSTDTLR